MMSVETASTPATAAILDLCERLASSSASLVEGRGDTRERLLEAAIEAFADDGFKATTVRHLAHAVKITPGAVYAHFPSKEAILSAAIARAYRQFLLDVVLPEDDASPDARLEGLCRRHMRFQLDNRAMAAASDSLLTSQAAMAAVEPTTALLLNRARALYGDALYQEVVRVTPRGGAVSPHAQTAAIRSLCNRVQDFAEGNRFDPAAIIDQYIALIWRMLGHD